MHKHIKIFILLFLISTPLMVKGQKMINSPYARFGPGIIEQQGILKSRSMGGAGIALRDPLSINYLNPASYSSIDTNSFVFDFGLEYQANLLVDETSSHYSDDVNFHHLAMAIPITKWMGFATGLIPYSNGYYFLRKTVSETDPEYDPIIGEYENTHKGSGSYNNFFAGLGISPFKNLSLGVNFTYLFGNIERDNLYLFTDDNNQFNNLSSENIRVYGYNLEYGVQYSISLKNDLFASAGLMYSMKQGYKSEYENIFTRYAPFQRSEYSVDTLSYTYDKDARVELPERMAVGINFGKKDVFMVSADYYMTKWDMVSFHGYEKYLVNSSAIKLGAEFIPDKNANYNYLNRIEYRLGGYFANSHLMINGERLKEFGITFGTGLPMNRSKSKINFHVEYLRRIGSLDNGLHTENCLTLGVSLNLYDYWFIKQKYN
ncbi:MAG: hypothetical protein RQ743_09400 [Bacteroidales bacterium]|nr:hypothetical protein [Bacteroidales bacterium]